MATEISANVSKRSLHAIHQKQLQNGFKNDENEHQIIEILGGIDDILTHLLNSNTNITQKQINEIHRVIANPHKLSNTHRSNLEDKQFHQNVTLKFNDHDTMLVSMVGAEKTKNILNALTNKITIVVLLFAAAMYFISQALTNYGLPWKVFYAVSPFMHLTYSVYAMIWILYANKKALKLLFRDFEFYFKLFYFVQFMMTNIGIGYFDDTRPWHNYWTSSIYLAAVLFLGMIFDAINIKKENKSMFSCVAAALFVGYAFYYSRTAMFPGYQDNLYHQAQITISNGLIFSDLKIRLFDVAGNSAKILTIFMCKQFISSIIKPKQSLIIKIKPFMDYEHAATPPKQKHVRLWRIACIILWCLRVLLSITNISVNGSNMNTVTFIFEIGRLVLFVTGFGFFISNHIKCIIVAIAMVFLIFIIDGVDALFMSMITIWPAVSLFFLGMVSVYLLKLRGFQEFELFGLTMDKRAEQKGNDEFLDDKKTEPQKVDEITAEKIMCSNKNKILFNNDDSKTYDEEDINEIDDHIKTTSPHIEMHNVDNINAVNNNNS